MADAISILTFMLQSYTAVFAGISTYLVSENARVYKNVSTLRQTRVDLLTSLTELVSPTNTSQVSFDTETTAALLQTATEFNQSEEVSDEAVLLALRLVDSAILNSSGLSTVTIESTSAGDC
jgi:hypothetical protein